jgi:hypothetical protein
MAKAKLSKSERDSWTKDLATLRAAVSQCEQVLKDDDEAAEKAVSDSDTGTIKSFANRAQGRAGTTLGVLAARELGRPGGPKQ